MKFTFENGKYEVEYLVSENVKENQPTYGILAKSNYGKEARLDNIFFTPEEALQRCQWLVENEVLPEIFRDVMENIMF